MLNSSSKSEFVFIPDFRDTAFSFSPFSVILVVGFLDALYCVKKAFILSIPVMKEYWIFVNAFPAPIERFIWFCLFY